MSDAIQEIPNYNSEPQIPVTSRFSVASYILDVLISEIADHTGIFEKTHNSLYKIYQKAEDTRKSQR